MSGCFLVFLSLQNNSIHENKQEKVSRFSRFGTIPHYRFLFNTLETKVDYCKTFGNYSY